MRRITNVRLLFCLIGIILLSASVSAQVENTKHTKTEKQYQKTELGVNKGRPYGLPILPETLVPNATMKASTQKVIRKDTPKNVPTLFGHLIFSSSWTNGDNAYGIYSFPAAADATVTESYIDYEFGTNNGVYANGKYYFYKCNEYGGFVFSSRFYIYNTNPWKQESVVECKLAFSSAPTSAITYDPVTDKIYAITMNDDLTGYYFCEIDDMEAGTFKRISTIENMYTLAACPNGLLYGIDTEGNLKTIDKFSGAVAFIGSTGLKPQNVQSMVADWDSNKLYWTAFGENLSGLYDVNTTNGEVTLISNFPSREEFVGLHIPDKVLATGAPANIKELNISQESKATSVTLSVPTTLQNGEVMTGNATVVLYIDGKKSDEVALQPGKSYQKTLELTNGIHVISAKAVNEAGESKAIYKQIYIGHDTPLEVLNPTLKVQGGEAELSWQAPLGSVHGGLYDPKDVTYKIVRYPGAIAITDNYKEMNYRDRLPSELNKYYYEIIACSNGYNSKVAATNYYVTGDALNPPYKQDFVTLENLNLITLIDGNNDDFSWRWKNEQMLYETNPDLEANDWIITPPLRMNAEYDYKVSFDVRASSDSYPESVKVTLGTTTDTLTQKTLLLDLPTITNSFNETQSSIFSVPQEGNYTIGINTYSAADSYNLYIDNLAIKPYAAKRGPKAVTDLKVIPAADGVLSTKISFIAPVQSRSNESLTKLLKIEIYRGTEKGLIHTLTDCKAGVAYEYTDNSLPKGTNTYTIVAFNEFGSGEEISQTLFVGPDKPTAATEFMILSGENNTASISWKAPEKGINGGYINQASLKYTLYKFDDKKYSYIPFVEATNTANTSFTDQITIPEGIQQIHVKYMVQAISEEGVSPDAFCSEMFGKSYELPFSESFNPKKFLYGSWAFVALQGNTAWKVGSHGMDAGAAPYDEDAGLLNYYNFEANECEARAISPKMNIDSAKNPLLKFMMYHTPALTNANWVIAEVYKEGRYIALGDTIFANAESGWKEYRFSLAAYKGTPVSVVFRGHIDQASSGFPLDKVTIENFLEYDLGVQQLKMPAKIDINVPQKLEAWICNFGSEKATAYQVEFYQDDKLINTQEGLDAVAKDTLVYTLPVNIGPSQAGESHQFTAKIVYAKDMNEDNNSASSIIDFVDPKYPVINDLKGIYQNEKSVLSWSIPQLIAIEKTENFDYYESFIIENIGNWTVRDLDGQAVFTINNFMYPNKQAPNAYQVWNPTSINLTADIWQPYSGKQCLVSFASAGEMPDGTEVDPKNNDWLISPEVKGNTRLSFYANESTDRYGDEQIEILVSSIDNRPESFTVLDKTKVTMGWKEYSYTLPANAKYFAIRHLSEDAFALLIDNITYTPIDNLSLKPLGYHVYRNGECITKEMITNTKFEDNYLKDAEYAVSVIYDRGESTLSNKVKITQSGISLNENPVEVYSQGNLLILKNVVNQNVAVYQADGRIVCKQFIDDAMKTIELPQGVYIIQLENGKKVKVILK